MPQIKRCFGVAAALMTANKKCAGTTHESLMDVNENF